MLAGHPAASGTGTLQIYLLDINDNAPHVFPPEVEMCERPAANGINITASDPDLSSNAGPFAFELAGRPSAVRRNWTLSRLNGQSGVLKIKLVSVEEGFARPNGPRRPVVGGSVVQGEGPDKE